MASDNGQTMTRNVFTTVIYEDVITDNYNAYDEASGLFTAPWDGNYNFYCQAQAIGIAGGTEAMMKIDLSTGESLHGCNSLAGDYTAAASSLAAMSATVRLTAGQTATVTYYFDDTTANRGLSANQNFNRFHASWTGF